MKVDSILEIEDPPRPIIPDEILDSILKTGFKDRSKARHRELEPGDPTQVAKEASEKPEILDLVTANLDNDFEHECFQIAVRRLSASQLLAQEGDIGSHVFEIPGIPNGRSLPHQVWGIWFLVERVIGNSPPVALLADDMGLGKTYTSLGALLHLKWISSQARSRRKLACLEDRTVEDLGDTVPPFFGSAKDRYKRPSVVMVPAPLVRQWESAIKTLAKGVGASLINLNMSLNRGLTSKDLNYTPGFPEREKAIHLISYETFRARARQGGILADCEWGLAIFDESHSVRTKKTLTFQVLCRVDVEAKFQLTGTPMYLNVQSWITQAEWLFSKVSMNERRQHGPERLQQILDASETGDLEREDVYDALKTAAYPWMIRRWAETKGTDGKPLVAKEEPVVEDVRLTFTDQELQRLNQYITNLKENHRDRISTVVHEWRLACISMSLAENDTVPTDGEDLYRQNWDPNTYHAGPAIRWLGETLVPILLGEPADGSPNKAVVFAPLPGQAWFIFWYFRTFHPGVKAFMYHAGMNLADRSALIDRFSMWNSPAALVLP